MTPLDLKDNIIVFDVDGVLFKYDFGPLEFRALPEKEWVRKNLELNTYYFAEKTNLFDSLIEDKNPMEMYILSTASSNYEQSNKTEALNDKYGNFREDNIIYVAKDEYKLEVLKYLREMYDSSNNPDQCIVVIEDNPAILQEIEALGNSKLKCYLVSDFV